MRLGELKKLLDSYPDFYPVYGITNAGVFDPNNRFPICLVECKDIEYKHYKEPILILEFNVS